MKKSFMAYFCISVRASFSD